MRLYNADFNNIKNKDSKVVRVVPPLIPFRVDNIRNKLIAKDTTNNNNIANGEYIVKASYDTLFEQFNDSRIADYHRRRYALYPVYAFDGRSSTVHHGIARWSGYRSGPYTWNGGGRPQSYKGGGVNNSYFTTKTTTNETIAGEWLQIKLPYKIELTRYTIKRPWYWSWSFPHKFTILGSSDEINWVILDRQDIKVDPRKLYNTRNPVKFNVQGFGESYDIFRIIIEKAGYLQPSLEGIELYGKSSCMGIDGECESYANIEPFDNNLMNNSSQLTKDIMDFNSKYNDYICNREKLKNTNIQCRNNVSYEDVNTAYNKIMTTNNNQLTGGSLKAVFDSDANNYTTHSNYKRTHNKIVNDHKKVLKLRTELDKKLMELYATEDSLAFESKRIFDNTIYTNLLVTALATTSIFYLFKQL